MQQPGQPALDATAPWFEAALRAVPFAVWAGTCGAEALRTLRLVSQECRRIVDDAASSLTIRDVSKALQLKGGPGVRPARRLDPSLQSFLPRLRNLSKLKVQGFSPRLSTEELSQLLWGLHRAAPAVAARVEVLELQGAQYLDFRVQSESWTFGQFLTSVVAGALPGVNDFSLTGDWYGQTVVTQHALAPFCGRLTAFSLICPMAHILGLAAIPAQAANLTSLHLAVNRLPADTLQHVMACPQLSDLSISFDRVCHPSGAEHPPSALLRELPKLAAACPRLRKLAVDASYMTSEGDVYHGWECQPILEDEGSACTACELLESLCALRELSEVRLFPVSTSRGLEVGSLLRRMPGRPSVEFDMLLELSPGWGGSVNITTMLAKAKDPQRQEAVACFTPGAQAGLIRSLSTSGLAVGCVSLDLDPTIHTPGGQAQGGQEQLEGEGQQQQEPDPALEREREREMQAWLAGAQDLAAALEQCPSHSLSLSVAPFSQSSSQCALLPKVLPALVTPAVMGRLGSLTLSNLDLGGLTSPLEHVCSAPFPVMQSLSLLFKGLADTHLAPVAGMHAPRLAYIGLGEVGGAGFEGLLAMCMRPQPVDAHGQPVQLVVSCTHRHKGQVRERLSAAGLDESRLQLW